MNPLQIIVEITGCITIGWLIGKLIAMQYNKFKKMENFKVKISINFQGDKNKGKIRIETEIDGTINLIEYIDMIKQIKEDLEVELMKTFFENHKQS